MARIRMLGWAGVMAAAVVAGGASFAMAAKPVKDKTAMPADCLSMDLSPYSRPEALQIDSASRKSLFQVEIASSEDQREQGLMCRTALKAGEGMLFEFNDAAPRTFWMQNTLIGLDIIYIGADGRIVSITKNAKPLDRTPLPSDGPATGVLEIEAGLSDKLGLKPGDKVEHPFFHTS